MATHALAVKTKTDDDKKTGRKRIARAKRALGASPDFVLPLLNSQASESTMQSCLAAHI